MRRARDEATLAPQAFRQAVDHGVQRLGQHAQLVAYGRGRQARIEVRGADQGSLARQGGDRPEGPASQPPARADRDQDPGSADHEQGTRHVRERGVDAGQATPDHQHHRCLVIASDVDRVGGATVVQVAAAQGTARAEHGGGGIYARVEERPA